MKTSFSSDLFRNKRIPNEPNFYEPFSLPPPPFHRHQTESAWTCSDSRTGSGQIHRSVPSRGSGESKVVRRIPPEESRPPLDNRVIYKRRTYLKRPAEIWRSGYVMSQNYAAASPLSIVPERDVSGRIRGRLRGFHGNAPGGEIQERWRFATARR